MGFRTWLAVLLALATIGWWYSPVSPRVPDAPEVVLETPAGGSLADRSTSPSTTGVATPAPAWEVLAANPLCPPPPRVEEGGAPLQSAVPASFPALRIESARLVPLAGFSVDARVLSRHDYMLGREARFSPTDLALGWDRMRDDAVLSKLEISQSSRWYHYRWREDPPIPPPEITRSSANMHMIPSDDRIAAALRKVQVDENVRIDGWLVELDDAGWRWRSSLSREDTGQGGCEVVYVCSIVVRPFVP